MTVEMGELRWYKGEVPVNIILKMGREVLVERMDNGLKFEQFRCAPNFLWRHKKAKRVVRMDGSKDD